MKKIFSLIFLISFLFSHSQTGVYKPAWELLGTTATTNNFLGTKNSADLVFKTNNTLRAKISSNGILSIMTNTLVKPGFIFRDFSAQPGLVSALYMDIAVPTTSNYAFTHVTDSSLLAMNATRGLSFRVSNNARFGILNSNGAPTSTINPSFTFFGLTILNSSATEISSLQHTSDSRQFLTGTIALQRDRYFIKPTYSGASGGVTLTTVSALEVESVTQGTNCVITNNYAIRGIGNGMFTGNLKVGTSTVSQPTAALDVTGNILATTSILSSSKTSGIGYAVGSGSTVTQATSRTTGVTINSITGSITLVSASGSTSWQSFTVTNSAVAANDVIIVNQRSGTDLNMINVTAVSAGSFRISFATTGGTTSEQPVFNFAVIKGQTN